jgi:hypothetical protein
MDLRQLLKNENKIWKRNPLIYVLHNIEELNIKEELILDFLNKYPKYPIDKKITRDGTPILMAAECKYYKVVEKLIDMGADLNQYQDFGFNKGLIELLIHHIKPNGELLKKILIHKNKTIEIDESHELINYILNVPDWKEYIDILIKKDKLNLKYSIYTYHGMIKVIDYLEELENSHELKKWIEELKNGQKLIIEEELQIELIHHFQNILKKEEEYKNLDVDNNRDDYNLVNEIFKNEIIDSINDIINESEKKLERLKNKFENKFEKKLDEIKISHIIFNYI